MAKKFTSKNVSVEWKYDLKKDLQENFSNRQWAHLSQYVIDQNILRKIDNGISPVQGERNFAKYKDKEKYPADKKPSNKPNLTLTGNMLSHYEARETNETMTITVGIHKDAPKEDLVKAIANNEGTQGKAAYNIARNTKNRKLKRDIQQASKGIPARPFIPIKDQSFTKDIILEIRKAFAYCLQQALNKRGNK